MTRRRLLLLLLVAMAVLEIWTMLEVGRRIGGGRTLLLLLLIAVVGVYVARREAAKVWSYAQRDIPAGHPPAPYVLDAACIFAGGVLLVLPGFWSDIAGLLLLIPFTRRLFRNRLSAWIQSWLARGRPYFFFRNR